jgi:putative flavoprotein involved in K+ transport
VIATGLYQSPRTPDFSAAIPAEILQIHSMEYKNPASLPDGAVLVVGTGQSGSQIAEELYQSGRKVFLSIGSAGRVPRRYRGKDINDWFTLIGMFDTKVEELKSPQAKFAPHPQSSGKNGGKSLNLHQFAREGVVLVGHVNDIRNGNVIVAPDLKQTLAKVDQFETEVLTMVDEYIAQRGLTAPPENVPQLRDGYEPGGDYRVESEGVGNYDHHLGDRICVSLQPGEAPRRGCRWLPDPEARSDRV